MASPLSAADWKTLLKAHADAVETAPVTKALEAYGKAEAKARDEPKAVLDALKKVVEAAKDAKSANFKDKKRKPVVDFLDDVLKDAATMKVKAERLLQEKAEREKAGDEEEDDEGGNERALLTERLFKVKKLDADHAKPFVFAKASKVHGLVIAKGNTLSAVHKKRARAMCQGNSRLFMGKVFGEKGKYVFLMDDKAPGGIARAIKKTAALHTDLPPLRVLVRDLEGTEIDDEKDLEEMAELAAEEAAAEEKPAEARTEPADRPASKSATPRPAPPSRDPKTGEKFKKLAKDVGALIDQVKADSPRGATMLLIEYTGHLRTSRGGEFDEATAGMKELEGKARKALKEAEKTAGSQAEAEAQWARRIAALTPRMKPVLAEKDERAENLKLAFSEANTYYNKKDFERANELLDHAESLLETDEETANKPLLLRMRFESEIEELEPKYLLAVKRQPVKATKLRSVWMFAQDKGEAQDYKSALKALKNLRPLLKYGATNTAKPPKKDKETKAFENRIRDVLRAAKSSNLDDKAKQSLGKYGKEAFTFMKAKDWPKANAALDEIEKVLEETHDPEKPSLADYKKKWQEQAEFVQKRLKSVLALNPPNAGYLKRLFVLSAKQAKPGGDIEKACERLDELDHLMYDAFMEEGNPAQHDEASARALRSIWVQEKGHVSRTLIRALKLEPENGKEIQGSYRKATTLSRDDKTLRQALKELNNAQRLALEVLARDFENKKAEEPKVEDEEKPAEKKKK